MTERNDEKSCESSVSMLSSDSGFLKADIITIVWSRKKPIADNDGMLGFYLYLIHTLNSPVLYHYKRMVCFLIIFF